MLAKSWKKILLAICVIACIYNVMAKIVNRHSLEENLRSANDGETVFNFSKEEKENVNMVEETSATNIINTTISENVVESEQVNKEENNGFLKSLFNFQFLF
jgi:hypothetical protein